MTVTTSATTQATGSIHHAIGRNPFHASLASRSSREVVSSSCRGNKDLTSAARFKSEFVAEYDGVHSVAQVELGEDRVDVRLHGGMGEVQFCCDFDVVEPPHDGGEDIPLARTQDWRGRRRAHDPAARLPSRVRKTRSRDTSVRLRRVDIPMQT